MKQLEYSIRYIILIILGYYLLFKNMYTLSWYLLAFIPINFLAIKYGIYYKINKDEFYTKDIILMELILLTTTFNVIFLSLNKINFIVIIICSIINILELLFTANINQTKKSK